jgi:hypothetical protein
VFWVVFALAAFSVMCPQPFRATAVSVAEFGLGVVWFGYPIALALLTPPYKNAGISAFIGLMALLVGIGLNAIGRTSDSLVWLSALGSLLVLIPFVLGANALTSSERAFAITTTANTILTGLAIMGLGFFGGYVQERFRAVVKRAGAV